MRGLAAALRDRQGACHIDYAHLEFLSESRTKLNCYVLPTRVFDHILDFATDDGDRIEVHEYTPLFGLGVKPLPNLRFNFDAERT